MSGQASESGAAESSPGGILMELPATLDMRAAADLQARMNRALEGDGDIRVDAHEVTRIATACVQVLLAAERSLAGLGTGRRLRVRRVSKAMKTGFDDLGLGSVIENWSDDE
jgi:anti-anti-sigma regulatory factor